MNLKKYDIFRDGVIDKWDEALPLGNGKLGCLVYGENPLRLTIDRTGLWDTRPNPTTLEKGFNYKNYVKLVKSGTQEDWDEYTRLFDSIYRATPYPSKVTAGRLELDFNDKSITKNYLSIKDAVATVYGENKKIEVFLSATRFIGIARVYGDYSLNIRVPKYLSGEDSVNESGIGSNFDVCMRYPQTQVISDGEFTYYDQHTLTDFCFGIVVLTKKRANYNEIYFTLAFSTDGDNYIENAKKQLLDISNVDYDILKEEHIKWWHNYWKKSEINIGDDLLEQTYYRSWYLFASTSRKGYAPMPIQGVWTADVDSLPPWKGDYHHDTNTQLSYQAYLKANHLPEGENFIDYLWDLRHTFKKFAKKFYGVNGILIPAVSTVDGKPMGGWPQYALSPTMTIWSAQSFDEYYIYTGDKKFLKNKAYPFFKGVADAIFGLLEEKDGKLYLPLSTSPEIHDNKRQSYLQPNSNFDLALLKYLYKTLNEYENILGINGDYTDILSKFDDFAIEPSGNVMLDKNEKLCVSHRHFSHLMCMYPLHLINYTPENKKIYEGSIWNLEFYGTGAWVGFSYAMSAQIYAMALMGNSAYEKLREFADGFVADNGFHLNGDFKNKGYSTFHYRPFTLESSFGYCDALHEMLMQDHMGYLYLFPAIPETWNKKTISFKSLRTVHGTLVSATLKNGVIESVKLVCKNDVNIKIKNTFGSDKVIFNGTEVLQQDGCFDLQLTKGVNYVSLVK